MGQEHEVDSFLDAMRDASIDCIVCADQSGIITAFNTAAEQTFGWSRQEVIGEPILDLLLPAGLATTERSQIDGVLRDPGSCTARRAELTVVDRDGRRFPAELTVTVVRNHGHLTFVLYIRDIAARVNAEKLLRETSMRAEQQFRHITQHARCLLWYGDITEDPAIGKMTWRLRMADDDAAQRLLPLDVPEGVTYAAYWGENRPPEDAEHARIIGERALRENRSYSNEFRCPNKYGEMRWLSEDVYVEPRGPGRWHAVGVCTDITDRKRAEEELRRQAELLEQTHDAIIVWEIGGGGITYFNSGAERLYGWSRAQVLGQRPTDLLKSELPCSIEEFEANLLRKGEWSGELTHRTRDGRPITVESRHVLIGDPSSAAFVLETNSDITTRKRAQQELRDVIFHARCILSHAEVRGAAGWQEGTGGFQWTVSIPYVEAAQALIPLHVPPGGTYEQAWVKARAIEDSKRMDQNFRNCLIEGRAFYGHEFRVTDKFGKDHWLSQEVHVEPAGLDRWRVVAVSTDVTERKRAEDNFRHMMSKARVLVITGELSALPGWRNGITSSHVIGRNWKMIDAQAALQLLPLDVDPDCTYFEALAKSRAKYPEDQQRCDRNLINAIATFRTGYAQEFRCRNKYGQERWLYEDALLEPIGEDSWRLITVVTDITELKQAEVEMKRAKEVAEAANRAKSMFLANMSHEIRTPMTAVLGYADRLLDTDLPVADRLKCVQTIRRNGNHLLAVINDILDLSKIEAGKLRVESISCSPQQLVEEVAAMMLERAAEKSVAFSVEYAWPLPEMIHTDPTRVRQILVNLVGNAIKFTEVGGVKMIVRRATECAGPCIAFDVIDTGIGIASEQLKGLFQPFMQADVSTTRRFGGTGLGLAISKRLAEMLGGDIEARSEIDKGSRFSLLLKAPESARLIDGPERLPISISRQPHSPTAAPPSDSLKGRVLLVEDGPDNQELILFYLQGAGLETTLAENGQIGFDLAMDAVAQGRPYDLILMDMQMPVMDGVTATAKLREAGYAGPIVALSANVMAGDRDRCLRAGCDDFADKPIDRPKLLSTIRHYLRMANAIPKATPTADPGGGHRDTGGHDSTLQLASPSKLSADEKFAPLLSNFVNRLPLRIAAIERALRERDITMLRHLVHQLKGAAGGFGFPRITDAARELEAQAGLEADLEQMRHRITQLAEFCEQARRTVVDDGHAK